MSAILPRLLITAGAVALASGVSAPTAFADPAGDPPGNNGTIKIDPYGATEGHANHPHPGCDFRLQLFGFDDDQTGTITFTGQAPTSGAVTKQPLSGTRLLSDDPARGGQDEDASFDVRGADLGLTGAPHAKQGYHIKVRVNADDAPGGAKTKVFWLNCPAAAKPADSSAPATSTSTAGSSTAPGTTTPSGTADQSSTASTSSTSSTQSSTGSTSVSTTAVQGATSGAATAGGLAAPESTASDVSAFTGGSAGAVRGSEVSSGRTAAPAGDAGALPFTGIPALALAGLGLGALTAGTLAVRAGRRRTASL